MQGKAKQALRDIYLAESRQTAEDALDRFKKLIREEVSQSGRVPGKRPPSAAGFLRLSGRALGALADDEPDRVHLCDGPIAAATNEGLRQPGGIVNDGLHAGPPDRAPLATPERFGSDCSCLRWKGIQGRFDGSGERRLTSPSTTFDNISGFIRLKIALVGYACLWPGGQKRLRYGSSFALRSTTTGFFSLALDALGQSSYHPFNSCHGLIYQPDTLLCLLLHGAAV